MPVFGVGEPLGSIRGVNNVYEGIWVHTDAYGCIRMHIGGKSVHLVAHCPNSSNELRHVFLKSDRSCQNRKYLSICVIHIYIYIYRYMNIYIYVNI